MPAMKKKKVLYINDYFNDENSLKTCVDRQMPYNHLWGSDIDDIQKMPCQDLKKR